MNPDFWHKKWESNEIGFHLAQANPLLVQYFPALQLQPGQRVLVPLCGKSLDIAWLLDQGCQVVGAELSALAIEQLCEQLGVVPEITETEHWRHYQAEGLDLFVGDVFNLTAAAVGPVDAVYDRAALVALPPAMRPHYTRHITTISDHAPQLLICFDYDQSLMAGPPFSVDLAEVRQHYGAEYDIRVLAAPEVVGGLKGVCAACELVLNLRAL